MFIILKFKVSPISKVLYLGGITNEKISLEILNNLLSNYGNVVKIIMLRNKLSALVEFENKQYATDTKEILNNIRLMGNTL